MLTLHLTAAPRYDAAKATLNRLTPGDLDTLKAQYDNFMLNAFIELSPSTLV